MDTTAMHNEIRPDEDLVEMLDYFEKILVLPFIIRDGRIHTLKFGLKHDPADPNDGLHMAGSLFESLWFFFL